jgi:hypothetical protein
MDGGDQPCPYLRGVLSLTLALILLGYVVAFTFGFILGALLGQRHSGGD